MIKSKIDCDKLTKPALLWNFWEWSSCLRTATNRFDLRLTQTAISSSISSEVDFIFFKLHSWKQFHQIPVQRLRYWCFKCTNFPPQGMFPSFWFPSHLCLQACNPKYFISQEICLTPAGKNAWSPMSDLKKSDIFIEGQHYHSAS